MTKKSKGKTMAKKNKEVIQAKKKKIAVKTKIKAPQSKESIKEKGTLKTNKNQIALQEKLQKQVVKLTTEVTEQSQQSEKNIAQLLTALESSFDEKLKKLQADFDLRIENLIANQHATPSPTQKPTSKQPANKTKAVIKKPTIASLKGVGPITQKKLAEAGFTTLKQIATPPVSKAAALQQFKKIRGFDTWQHQATALLGLNK